MIETYDDEVQFLSACCASGGITYGRSSSQAAESQNSHIADARAQHLVSSILWITYFKARRYDEWAERSLAERLYAPPSIRMRMNECTDLEKTGPLGTVTTGEALSTNEKKIFTVRTTPQRRHEVQLDITRDESGNILSRFGSCSCGNPNIYQLPCKHMDAPALAGHYDERKLIPMELTTSRWKLQYPVEHKFNTTTGYELIMAGNYPHLRDKNIRVPVTAPRKRGRPPTKRAKHAVERSFRRRIGSNQHR